MNIRDFHDRLTRLLEDGVIDPRADVFAFTDAMLAHPVVAIDPVNREPEQLALSGVCTLCFVRLQ